MPDLQATGDFEVYAGGRYMTMTGRHVEGTPLEVREWDSLAWLWEEAVGSAIAEGKKNGRPLRAGWDPEVELAKAGLKFRKKSSQGRVFFNYHTLSGRCLVKGALHEGNRTNNECCAFVLELATRRFWHTCFAARCKALEGVTRKALIRLGVDPEVVFDKTQKLAAPLVVFDLPEFKVAVIAEREALLVAADGTAILTQQFIAQLFAYRGVGKTMVALALAGALAAGDKFLGWRAPRRVKCLYVEGELPDRQVQDRVKLLVPTDTHSGFFRIVTRDAQPNGIRSISTPEGRKAIEDALGDAEVLLLDSISTLANMGTNDEDNWLELNEWFRDLRSKYKLCLVFLHHAGKGGLQRGHSKSEDPLDLSIKLSRPDDYLMTDGLRCVLEFDKCRGQSGLAFEDLEFALRNGVWTYERKQTALREAVLKMHAENPGWKSRRIAKELGCGHSIVARYLKEAKKQEQPKQAEIKYEEEKY